MCTFTEKMTGGSSLFFKHQRVGDFFNISHQLAKFLFVVFRSSEYLSFHSQDLGDNGACEPQKMCQRLTEVFNFLTWL